MDLEGVEPSPISLRHCASYRTPQARINYSTEINMEETYLIYALIDPVDHVVGYIGVTTQELDKRLTQHIAEAADGKGGIKKREWINDILQSGDYPLIMELDHCQGDEWPAKEQYWIDSFRSRGYELTNTSDGGIGNPGVVKSEETKERISQSMKEYKSTIH